MDPTILVVEDDDDLRYTLTEILEAEGYQVITASSVDEAVGLLPRVPVSLVVTDLKLGGALTGWDLARLVAELRPPLPVVAFTGSEGVEQLMDSGLFADAIEKGDPSQLLPTLASLLPRR